MGRRSKRKDLKNSLWVLLIAVFVSLFVILTSEFSLFKNWELKTYDLRMRLLRSDGTKPKNVVLFYVDEASLEHMEREGINWPWPRELYSMVLDFCRRGGALSVVFDLFFSEESVYGVADDAAFAGGVSSELPTYFVTFLSKSGGETGPEGAKVLEKSGVPFAGEELKLFPKGASFKSLPIPELINVAAGFGNAQTPPDEDGVYRRVTLLSRLNEEAVPLISLKVASDIKKTGKITLTDEEALFLDDEKIPLDKDNQMLINYYGGTDTFPTYPLARVILSDSQLVDGKQPDLDAAVVKDKIVIVGVAAPGLYDMKSSPFSRVYPGAEVHATVIENILRADFIRPLSPSAVVLIIIVVTFFVAAGLARISTSWGIALWIFAVTAALVGTAFYFFSKGVWLPLVAPFGAILFSALTMVLFRFLTEGKKKREIRKAFGQYLSPDVVAQIAESPESLRLGGEEKEITILFSDIADFTTISEKMPPTELVEKLNEYFSMATKIIHKYGGTLDKYIGDAIMAFWGAPLKVDDHAKLAVNAALDIQSELKALSAFVTRIGIHTSPAVVGNIGSDIRFNYTAIGDAVNLSSRLEGLNKKFGTRIIISEATYEKLKGLTMARRVGRVRVKGRGAPVGIYEPLGMNAAIDEKNAANFERGLDIFEKGGFKEAEAVFEKLISETDDPVSKYYKKECVEFKEKPPENFDGVSSFETK